MEVSRYYHNDLPPVPVSCYLHIRMPATPAWIPNETCTSRQGTPLAGECREEAFIDSPSPNCFHKPKYPAAGHSRKIASRSAFPYERRGPTVSYYLVRAKGSYWGYLRGNLTYTVNNDTPTFLRSHLPAAYALLNYTLRKRQVG